MMDHVSDTLDIMGQVIVYGLGGIGLGISFCGFSRHYIGWLSVTQNNRCLCPH